MRHDLLFKELLTTFFYEFLELFVPELSSGLDRRSLTPVDKEVLTDVTGGSRQETDLLVQGRLTGHDALFLVHVEHQAQKQAGFAHRMFRYYTHLRMRGLPVYPIALFSYSSPKVAEPNEYTETFLGVEMLRFRFRTIQLNQMRWRDYLDRPNPVACALMARMQIPVAERAQVKVQCLRLLASLRLDAARSYLISGFINSYLQLSSHEVLEFQRHLGDLPPEEEHEVLKFTNEWTEKGRQEGRQEGFLNALRVLLEQRFGPEGLAFAGELDGRATSDQLEQLIRAVHSSELEDLRRLAG